MPRYTGPLEGNNHYGSLGNVSQRSFFGGQQLNGVGSLQEDIRHYDPLSRAATFSTGLGAAMLSDNEKRLVTIGVIGLVGWFFFGDKIRKALK